MFSKQPKSAALRAQRDALDTERSEAQRRHDGLLSAYDETLLSGDLGAAEQNETTRAALGRQITSLGMRIEALEPAIAAAEEQEAEAELRKRQAKASAARDALLRRVSSDYEAPARTIAAFLRDYEAVTEECKAAGVPGPHDMIRVVAPEKVPASIETYHVFIDEKGNETDSAFPPGVWRMVDGKPYDPNTRQPIRQRRSITKSREIPATERGGYSLPDLPRTVNLPQASIKGASFHEGAGLVDREQIARKLKERGHVLSVYGLE